MKRSRFTLLLIFLAVVAQPSSARADSRGDELARWIDERGSEVWGAPPTPCDDLTFARRVYLDLIGRVPSVSELRDFQSLGENRRSHLVEQLVFAEGPRAKMYERLRTQTLARQWQDVLLPPGTTVEGSPETLRLYLADAFASGTPFDELMSQVVSLPTATSAGQYYQLLGSLPENYAGAVSRAMLGVRIECAQCHDHPFTDWKQSDFWGLAAFYSDLPRRGNDPTASSVPPMPGMIQYEGKQYPAKLLWTDAPLDSPALGMRGRLADWLTAAENPHFSSTAVNRFWQQLVGRGLYADVENLDQAFPEEREFLDELGQRFADSGYEIKPLVAAICKSRWYQSVSVDEPPASEEFARTLKVISPDQVFDSLEQSLLLPVSRINPASPRWSGQRGQLLGRLGESVGTTPEDYAAGIPQALLLMNGKLTNDAVDPERSRLLRAVVESPFFDESDRIETLYLAVLTRQPTAQEQQALTEYLDNKPNPPARRQAYGEILWALLNSPEFVLCR